jgi:hypothetical protein
MASENLFTASAFTSQPAGGIYNSARFLLEKKYYVRML